MTNFLKKKLIGTPEDKARKQQLKQDMDAARWKARRKGSIERARKEGYQQGKGTQRSGLSFVDPSGGLGGFGGGGAAINPFGNPFGGPAQRRRSSPRHGGSKGKGTTIKVNGATITVHNRQKNRQHRHHRRREPDFPF